MPPKPNNKHHHPQIRKWLEDEWLAREIADELGIEYDTVRHFRSWNMEPTVDARSDETAMLIWFLRYSWRVEADFQLRRGSGMYNEYVDNWFKE